jgi:uncharacterized repeat protein (TIGR03803 family)
VAFEGGSAFCDSGAGVVFKIDPSGNETVLHTFGGADGADPDSVLLLDSEGNLYGTTENGGTSNGCGFSGCGTVFELSPQGNGTWSETVLYSFCSLSECADGEEPGTGPLVEDATGNLIWYNRIRGQLPKLQRRRLWRRFQARLDQTRNRATQFHRSLGWCASRDGCGYGHRRQPLRRD